MVKLAEQEVSNEQQGQVKSVEHQQQQQPCIHRIHVTYQMKEYLKTSFLLPDVKELVNLEVDLEHTHTTPQDIPTITQ